MSGTPADEIESAADEIITTAVTASPTTFENPILGNDDTPSLNRTVTIYASGSVSVDGALKPSTITVKQEDIRAAIGVGADQW
jgi:hypothetical protein